MAGEGLHWRFRVPKVESHIGWTWIFTGVSVCLCLRFFLLLVSVNLYLCVK